MLHPAPCPPPCPCRLQIRPERFLSNLLFEHGGAIKELKLYEEVSALVVVYHEAESAVKVRRGVVV